MSFLALLQFSAVLHCSVFGVGWKKLCAPVRMNRVRSSKKATRLGRKDILKDLEKDAQLHRVSVWCDSFLELTLKWHPRVK